MSNSPSDFPDSSSVQSLQSLRSEQSQQTQQSKASKRLSVLGLQLANLSNSPSNISPPSESTYNPLPIRTSDSDPIDVASIKSHLSDDEDTPPNATYVNITGKNHHRFKSTVMPIEQEDEPIEEPVPSRSVRMRTGGGPSNAAVLSAIRSPERNLSSSVVRSFVNSYSRSVTNMSYGSVYTHRIPRKSSRLSFNDPHVRPSPLHPDNDSPLPSPHIGPPKAEVTGSTEIDLDDQEGSTVSQSVFNCVNLLVGIGFLSLPFALRSGGWIPGLMVLISVSLITKYTGEILARCIELSPTTLLNFDSISSLAISPKISPLISVIFITELYLTCVAFIILISDSIHIIFPTWDIAYFRFVAFVICAGITYLKSFKVVSYLSLVGIIASVFLISVVLFNGLVKTARPGSLWDWEHTTVWPEHTHGVALSFGIVLAGYAGHAVLPGIYLDMRDRTQFSKVLNISFSIASAFYIIIACAGYLMFGQDTMEEITQNLADKKVAVNSTLNTIATCLIAIIPIPKFALTMAPVATALDIFVGSKFYSNHRFPQSENSLESAPLLHSSPSSETSPALPPRRVQLILRTLLALGTALIPFIFPHFSLILALLGSIFSFIVSVALPCICYLRLFYYIPKLKGEKVGVGKFELTANLLIVGVGSVIAVWATGVEIFAALEGLEP
ncbi:hypothetical protein HK098_003737 [Nowakowskiella sp. JEL0407]|nr:hypothetical protein HK098_003737 [Nowakowskiella sp. JEL0407]